MLTTRVPRPFKGSDDRRTLSHVTGPCVQIEKEAFDYTYGMPAYEDLGKAKGPAEEPYLGLA